MCKYYNDTEYQTDNRDSEVTEIHLEHRSEQIDIEVRPWDLVENLIENTSAALILKISWREQLQSLRDEVTNG